MTSGPAIAASSLEQRSFPAFEAETLFESDPSLAAETGFRMLNEDGRLVTDYDTSLTPEEQIKLYRSIVLARAVDERMLNLQRQGRIGTFALCSGQEAAACGPTMAMRDTDWWVGSFRELGGRLLRGEPIESPLMYFGGYEEGNTFPGGERTLPSAVIIASQALHAVGIAYAMRLKGETDTAVLCFFGDGATSEGDFHEAMNFASVWQVPVVFVCANNQYAISLPRAKQTRSRTIAQKAVAYEMPGIAVDGNDPLAMYEVAKQALDRARAGGGPTLIEAITYRLKMHTTADDPTRYRSDEEVSLWQQRDPIVRFRRYLTEQGLWNDDMQAALDQEVGERIDTAVKNYESMTDFKPDAPFDHIYGTKHSRIDKQRAEFLSNLEKEESHG